MPKKIKTVKGWGIMAGVVMRGLFFHTKTDAKRVARAYGDKVIEVELIPRRIERRNQDKPIETQAFDVDAYKTWQAKQMLNIFPRTSTKPLAEVKNGWLYIDEIGIATEHKTGHAPLGNGHVHNCLLETADIINRAAKEAGNAHDKDK